MIWRTALLLLFLALVQCEHNHYPYDKETECLTSCENEDRRYFLLVYGCEKLPHRTVSGQVSSGIRAARDGLMEESDGSGLERRICVEYVSGFWSDRFAIQQKIKEIKARNLSDTSCNHAVSGILLAEEAALPLMLSLHVGYVSLLQNQETDWFDREYNAEDTKDTEVFALPKTFRVIGDITYKRMVLDKIRHHFGWKTLTMLHEKTKESPYESWPIDVFLCYELAKYNTLNPPVDGACLRPLFKLQDKDKMLRDCPGSDKAIVLLCGDEEWVLDILRRAKRLGFYSRGEYVFIVVKQYPTLGEVLEKWNNEAELMKQVLVLTAWPGQSYEVKDDAKFSWIGYAYQMVIRQYALAWNDDGKPSKKIQRFKLEKDDFILLANADFLPVYALLGFNEEAGVFRAALTVAFTLDEEDKRSNRDQLQDDQKYRIKETETDVLFTAYREKNEGKSIPPDVPRCGYDNSNDGFHCQGWEQVLIALGIVVGIAVAFLVACRKKIRYTCLRIVWIIPFRELNLQKESPHAAANDASFNDAPSSRTIAALTEADDRLNDNCQRNTSIEASASCEPHLLNWSIPAPTSANTLQIFPDFHDESGEGKDDAAPLLGSLTWDDAYIKKRN